MKVLMLFMLLGLASCSVAIPKVPACVELGPDRGHCVNTVTADEFIVDEARPYEGLTWWQMRPAMVNLPAQSWAEIKAFVIKICKKTGKCDTNLGDWERVVNKVDEMVKKNE